MVRWYYTYMGCYYIYCGFRSREYSMRVLGIESNIGSMLWPFQEAGHEILAACDSRGIINQENYLINFPKSKLYDDMKELVSDYSYEEIDVIACQPSCSKFSQLSRRAKDDYEAAVDIKSAIEAIKPKFFIIESKLDYIYEMPVIEGYNYNIEYVNNYYYGNVQKSRERLWIIASRKDIEFSFIPSEFKHDNTVESVIEGLPDHDDESIDHVHEYKPFLKNSITGEYLSLDEAFEMLEKDGKLSYIAKDGQTKHRINRKIANPKLSTTITGGGTWFHWRKKYPLTVRERARIQGFPDEFSFKGLSNTKKDKAVGKSIPLEFTKHLVSLFEGGNYIYINKLTPEPVKLTLFKRNFSNNNK